MAKGREWTQNDLFFLEKNYSILSVEEVAKELGRTKTAIHQKAKEFNLVFRAKKNKVEFKKVLISFTPLQNQFLSGFNNKSEIVRKALSKYMLSQKKESPNFKEVKPMNEIEKLILISKKSAKELAPILNTTEARMSEYKTGKRGISVKKLREWCEILKINIRDCF